MHQLLARDARPKLERMTEQGANEDPGRRPRRRGVLMLIIGIAGVCAAFGLLWRGAEPAARIELTAGYEGTTRSLVAHALCDEVTAHGTRCEVVETGSSQAEIESVGTGAIELALVSAVYRSEHPDPHVRIVAPLQMEALHLLVGRELADGVDAGLAGLRGKEVDLGPSGSAGASLAADVLAFAEIEPATAERPDGYIARNIGVGDLQARAESGDRAGLPPAIFHLGTMPSRVVESLVRDAGYVLVPLPFAESFRLQAILEDDASHGASRGRRLVSEATIPPFLYEAKPAVPAAPLPTLGVRLLLLGHDRVSSATIGRVLESTFDTRFAHLLHPSLDHSLLLTVPRHELHAGTLDYLARREPAITGEAVSDLSNSLSVLGALAGGGAFLFQGFRQRQRAQRESLVANHLRRVAGIERRIVEAELGASLELDTLISVQRELLLLKSQVLDHFTSGALGDPSTLSSVLDPIDAAREHVGELLLHIRDQLEDKAQSEGRTSTAVWNEAVAESEAQSGTETVSPAER